MLLAFGRFLRNVLSYNISVGSKIWLYDVVLRYLLLTDRKHLFVPPNRTAKKSQ